MIIRQLSERQREQFHDILHTKAHMEPLEASYTVNMTIDGVKYVIKVQPERHNKIAVLQALRIFEIQGGPRFELITKGAVLSSLLEILIDQGVRQ